MTGILLLILRAAFSIICIATIIPIMTVTWLLGARMATRRVMQAAFTAGAWVWGVRIHVRGALASARPLLIVSNHFSYLDMFVLGSRVPAAFTPKSEIASWPVLGFMCKMAGCVFIERRVSRTHQNRESLARALEEGDIISLFPESTTNDGSSLLPFKSAFFSLAEGKAIFVQPVSIHYTKLNGKPLTVHNRLRVGWYGDAPFLPHVLGLLRERSVEATLVYHEPVRGDAFTSRKRLAAYCHEVIGNSLHPKSKDGT